jgi:MYXO-CTERM domain-containing protein
LLPTSKGCFPLSCDDIGSACAAGCLDDDQCADGFLCESGNCVPIVARPGVDAGLDAGAADASAPVMPDGGSTIHRDGGGGAPQVGGDAAAPPDAGQVNDAKDDGGCGCRLAAERNSTGGAWLLLVLAAAGRRRREKGRAARERRA